MRTASSSCIGRVENPLDGGSRNLELRLEAFNLVNHFNWGVPVTNLGSGTFGRITAQATSPRIIQFGVKYGF